MAARREPNSRLRDVIAAVGCTYEALARDVRRIAAENGEILQTNKSAISHWVNGTRAPSGRVGRYLAEALSRRAGRTVTQTQIGLQAGDDEEPAESDPVLAATDLGRADVERRRFLAIAAFTTAGVAMPLGYDHEATARMLRARTGRSLVGAEDVDVVRQITAAFSAADERLGGGHGLTTVTAYLADTAAPMLRGRFPSEALRRAAFGAVAELAYLAGWKHHEPISSGCWDGIGHLSGWRSVRSIQVGATKMLLPVGASVASSRDQVRDSSTRCSQGAVQSSSQSRPGPEMPYVRPASTRQNWE